MPAAGGGNSIASNFSEADAALSAVYTTEDDARPRIFLSLAGKLTGRRGRRPGALYFTANMQVPVNFVNVDGPTGAPRGPAQTRPDDNTCVHSDAREHIIYRAGPPRTKPHSVDSVRNPPGGGQFTALRHTRRGRPKWFAIFGIRRLPFCLVFAGVSSLRCYSD